MGSIAYHTEHARILLYLIVGGLLGIPPVLGLVLAGGVDEIPVLAELFSAPRLVTLQTVVVRAVVVATIGALIAVPVGMWFGRLRNQISTFVAAGLLIAPFFVSEPLKAFAWAELLNIVRTGLLTTLGPDATGLASFASPYTRAAPLIPLVVSAIPIVATTVAVGYRSISQRLILLREVSSSRGRLFRMVIAPLLLPYVLLGWLLAFGFVFPSSIEEQYLGGSANNLTTLMESLVRTGVGGAQLFSAILIAAGGVIAFISMAVVGRRFARPRLWQRLGVTPPLLDGGQERTLSRRQHPRLNWGPPLYVVVLMVAWLPICFVLAKGFFDCGPGCVPSLGGFQSSLSAPRVQAAVYNSMQLGLAGAVAGAVFGLAGVWLGLMKEVGRGTALVIVLSLLTPSAAMAIGFGQVARLLGANEGATWLVMISQLTLIFPYCFAIGLGTGLVLPRDAILGLEEFGTRAAPIIRWVVARHSVYALASASVFGFVLTLNDAIRPFYLGGANEALGSLVAAQLQAGQIGGANQAFGLGAALLLFGLVGLGVVSMLSYRMTIYRR